MPARCRVAISVGAERTMGGHRPGGRARPAPRRPHASGRWLRCRRGRSSSRQRDAACSSTTSSRPKWLTPWARCPKFPDGMMNASVRFMQERAMPVTLGSYMAALRQRDHLVRQWQHFMQTYPVILLPPCLSVSMPVRPAETADLNVRELYQQLQRCALRRCWASRRWRCRCMPMTSARRRSDRWASTSLPAAGRTHGACKWPRLSSNMKASGPSSRRGGERRTIPGFTEAVWLKPCHHHGGLDWRVAKCMSQVLGVSARSPFY